MSSIGKISLDLSVNSKKFSKQIDGIGKQAKKSMGKLDIAMGNIIANLATKAVAAVGDFVADSIKKGSDLQELDNVVSSVFTSMTEEVENFADTALEKFGLTESQSKKMLGTFGAMSRAFGYTEKQAFAMSSALTGLAGDVASFYNLSHDEAYTKLKSVFTGETESLKELGVVMTQAALDEFALAKGLGHTTNAMSEQEKVALRLAFVQDKLAIAAGDFEKTSGNWANQTRILAGQFESLKAAIGQGLIAALTPVIRVINIIMGKLVALANTFRNFMQMIFGGGGSSGAGGGMKEVANAAGEAAGATGEMENAAGGAAKAAEKAKKSLMGFDEINKLQSNDTGGGGGGAGGGGFDFAAFEAGETAAEKALDKMNAKLKEMIDMFKKGFKDGLGDDFENSLKRIKGHLEGIKNSFKEIFSDSGVQKAASDFGNNIAFALGQTLGAIVSMATTIAELFVGSIDVYLQQNKAFIKERIIGLFDAAGELSLKIAELCDVVAEIFEVFRSPEAKQIGADLIGIFANAGLSILQLVTQLGTDILNCIVQPLQDNKDKIKEALINTFKPISTVTTTLREAVNNTFTKIFEVYEQKIKPMFQSFANGISSIVSTLLDAYNTHIAPVLSNLAAKFKDTFEAKVQPAINKGVELIGKLAELIKVLWENILVPFINWYIQNIAPVVGPVLEAIGKVALQLLGDISTMVGGIYEYLGGLIDFLIGVFTLDWNRCWEGIKTSINGFRTATEALIQGFINFVTGIFGAALIQWQETNRQAWENIKLIFSNALTAIKTVVSTMLNAIKTVITTIISAIKNYISTKWTEISTKTTTMWTKIKSTISNAITNMQSKVSSGLNSIKSTFTSVFNSVKSTLTSILNGIKSAVSGTVSSIKSAVRSMANGVISTLNGMINALNSLNITIPDWVPGIGGNKFSLSIPNLPMLAQGGYVRANQPQPVIVGDNKTQGEIIAPENKMLEITMLALEKFFGKLMDMGYNSGNKDNQVGDIVIPIYLDGTLLDEVIVTAQQRRNMRSGGRSYAAG